MRHSQSQLQPSDPSALRALAHPLRVRIMSALHSDGPLTVGALSGRLDAAPGSISYHLGTLARHGLVEEAPELARDGRERWWRAAADLASADPARLPQDPEQRNTSRAMRAATVQRYAAELLGSLDAETTLGREWGAAGTMGDAAAWLTAEELAVLSGEIEELAQRWAARGVRNPQREREGARRVTLIYAALRRP